MIPQQEKIKKSIIFANKYNLTENGREGNKRHHHILPFAAPLDNKRSRWRERIQLLAAALFVTCGCPGRQQHLHD